jgi:hypothetical protein
MIEIDQELKTMNFRKNSFITFALIAIVFTLSAVSLAQTEQARGQFALYGMHSISGGQTLRISVQNPRASDAEIIPCIRVRIVFDVYEAIPPDQQRLRFVRRVSRVVELDPGDASTFDLAVPRTSNGEFISPMVFAHCEGICPSDPSRARVLSTVAVREGGRTVLLLPAVIKGFDPQPDPPAAREP